MGRLGGPGARCALRFFKKYLLVMIFLKAPILGWVLAFTNGAVWIVSRPSKISTLSNTSLAR